MLVTTSVDPLTATFGANGRPPSPRGGEIDVALGALRRIPAMAQLWDGISFGAEILRSIEAYPGTQGSKPVLRAIADLSWCERGVHTDPTEIVCTHGALHGLSVALATLPPGTPVLYPQPAFGYPFAIERAGVRRVPLDWPVGATVAQLLAKAEEHLARVREPAALIVCFPATRRGRRRPPRNGGPCARSSRLTAPCSSSTICTGSPTRGRLDLEGDDVILVDSLSKRFGAPGLRFGWVSAEGPRFRALREVAAATSVGVGHPSAILAEHALRRYLADRGSPGRSADRSSRAVTPSAPPSPKR